VESRKNRLRLLTGQATLGKPVISDSFSFICKDLFPLTCDGRSSTGEHKFMHILRTPPSNTMVHLCAIA